MLAEERQARIAEYVQRKGSVSTMELMSAFDASESTIRRDLSVLSRRRLVARVHGGATKIRANSQLHDEASASRSRLNASAKEAIARVAVGLVEPDDFVYIDGGTTTITMAEMMDQTSATFVTDSLPVAQRLLGRGCHVILLGGTLKPLTEVVVGAATVEAISRMHFTVGFFGANGVTPEAGFTTPELEEATVKEAALRQTQHAYGLCDSSKFDRVSPVGFGAFEDATIITDAMPCDPEYRQYDNFVEVKG